MVVRRAGWGCENVREGGEGNEKGAQHGTSTRVRGGREGDQARWDDGRSTSAEGMRKHMRDRVAEKGGGRRDESER